MKKFLSFALAAVICLAFLCSCGKKSNVYNYTLNEFTASIWGGQKLDDVTVDAESCTLVFDAENKEIEFLCDGNTFKGTLTDQRSQGDVDMWKVVWENNPEGSADYKFSYSVVVCNPDYKKASPFVFLLFYFDGEKDSLEITFSMKNAD